MPQTTLIIEKRADAWKLMRRLQDAGYNFTVRVTPAAYYLTLPDGGDPQDFAELTQGISYRIEYPGNEK